MTDGAAESSPRDRGGRGGTVAEAPPSPPVGSPPATEGGRTSATAQEPRGDVDSWLSWAAAVTSVLGLLVLVGLPTGDGAGTALRGVLLSSFWLVAPGAAIASRLRLPSLTKIAQAPLIGLGILVVTAAVGAWTGIWVPRLSAAVVAVAVLVSVGLQLRDRALPIRRVARPDRPTVLMAGGLFVSFVLWLLALPQIGGAPPSVFGLLVSGPVFLPLALLGVVVVLLAAVRGRRTAMIGVSAAGLVLLTRATASFVVSEPINSWTYKHIGVVEELQRQHHVVSGSDIYMNWPGMFAASAWLSDASGVPAIDLARWVTPVVHIVIALQVAALARVLGADRAGSATAAALAVAVNWVGQDYFAPQALAICLAAGVLVLLVQSDTSRTSALLALCLFGVIVATHQLTPFWLVGVTVVLAVLRRVPWWLTVAMLAVLIGYVIPRYGAISGYGLFTGFDLVGNAASNVAPSSAPGRTVGGVFARSACLLMWGATLLVLLARVRRLGWWRGWRSPEVTVPAVLAFSSFVILGGQSYGGEAVLRVVLYSTLGCSAVLGPALLTALRGRAVLVGAATVWTVVLAAVTAQASFGQWPVNLMRSEDVAAATWLSEDAQGSVVIPVLWDWPGLFSDYDRYVDATVEEEGSLNILLAIQAAQAHTDPRTPTLQALNQIVARHPDRTSYVVFTSTMRAWDEYYGEFTPGSYQKLLDDLGTSPEWALVRHEGDLWVFERPPAAG
jgi:hypothetical protein